MASGDNTIEITVAQFRTDFPEFTEALYPDNIVQSRISLAYCYISNSTYGCISESCRTTAIELMVAHLLTIWNNVQGSGGTSTLGQALSSKIGDVSVQLVAPPTKTLFQYWINSTAYGQQYYALLIAHASVPRYKGGTYERTFWTNRNGRIV